MILLELKEEPTIESCIENDKILDIESLLKQLNENK